MSALLAAVSPAAAADDSAAGVRVFDHDYFAGTQARTARDLIERLPGFAFDGGGGGVRGYSGSAGNVLIDGNRPASKSGSLGEALDRIPVTSVERVELIRGSVPGVNMQGHTVLANVVRRSEPSSTSRAELGLIAHGDGRVLPQGRLEGSRQTGSYLVEGSMRAFDFPNEGGQGYDRQWDAAGNLLRDSLLDTWSTTTGFDSVFAVEWPRAEGGLRMNVVLTGRDRHGERHVEELLADSQSRQVTENDTHRRAELGVSFDHNLNDTSAVQLLTIHQRQSFDNDDLEISNGRLENFLENGNSGESIVRATVSTNSPGRSTEWGGEAAFNFLRSDIMASRDGMPVQLPNGSVDVEERRGEAFGRINWTIGSTVTAELGAAYELSTIAQQGDSPTSKTLSYFKPSANLSWTPKTETQVRLSVQRNVGQLEFGDFISSANLSTGTVNAGNGQLNPSTSWDVVVAWEQQVLGNATRVISVSHSRIADVVDIVALRADADGDGTSETYEGLGNIGTGARNELGVELTVPLDGIGVSGGLLTSDLRYVQASVLDPFTAQRRHISDTREDWSGELEFTQDVPDWRLRWGARYVLAESEPEYRRAEVRAEQKDPWYELYGEYFLESDWAVEMKLRNLGQRERLFTRNTFDAPRGVGILESVRAESRSDEPSIEFKVRREFL